MSAQTTGWSSNGSVNAKNRYSVVYFKSGLMDNQAIVKNNIENPELFIDTHVKPHGFQYIIVEKKGIVDGEQDLVKYRVKAKGFINLLSITCIVQTLIIFVLFYLLFKK